MKSFRHTEPALRIFSGADCLGHLEADLARQGVSRAVIMTSRSFRDSTLLGLVRTSAGKRCAGVFSGVKSHTPHESVVEAAAELARLQADAVIVLGGGSATVSARAAAIYYAEGNDLDALCTRRVGDRAMHSPKLAKPKIPMIVAPTTPNSAYVKAGAGVFDTAAGERKAVFDPQTRARSVFLHPDLLLSAPAPLVVSASLDNLVLAFEALLADAGDDISDGLLIHTVRLMRDGLPRLANDDSPDLRGRLAMAGILTGRGTDHAPAGAVTALGHAIGPNHHIDNGVAKAVILPHMMRFNAPHVGRGAAKVAAALGIAEERATLEQINNAMDRLFSALALPKRLGDLGLAAEDLPGIAERAMKDWFILGNVAPIRGADELLGVLEAAL